jgi:Xaa-Pro aminopeptidase
MNMAERIVRLRQKFAEKEIEAMLVSQPDNLFYLSGCEGLEGYLFITGSQSIIITDFRYVEQAERQSPHCSAFRISGKMADWMPKLFAASNIKHLGFESSHLSFASYTQIAEIVRSARISIELTPVDGIVDSLRMIKEPEEIELIRRAINITDSVYEYLKEVLKAGMSERQLAWEIEKFQRDRGSQPVPFELIVAAGPNSALPHAKPSDYLIKESDPVVIDIGAKCNYYGSDLTRTLYTGKASDTFRKIYSIVLEAQLASISQIKAGMTGREADAIARSIISHYGYGEAFGHSLGHGIGLVTHEKPTIGPNSTDVLTNGMVFTIEPGIYISGWGGVRIEDDVVIENDRLQVLSSAGK